MIFIKQADGWNFYK